MSRTNRTHREFGEWIANPAFGVPLACNFSKTTKNQSKLGPRMCGIAGEINFASPPDAENVRKLIEKTRHRGPDDAGLWQSKTNSCVLGHARLSIIDLSPLGHQPMIDPKTGNALVFNGEIYNYQDLRNDCESYGDRFRSESDTEVILALYRRLGVKCLEKLRGMFAIGLWDEEKQTLLLARDRVGKKPLNYSLTQHGIIFCSEIYPLSRHEAITRDVDPEALELYFQTQSIPAPWTIYKNIRKLPPAHIAFFDRGGLKIERYWNVDYRRKVSLNENEALEALEEKLTQAVRLRMIADVPLGALLSGGVDSSLIVALMARLSNSPVRTFSIGFDEESHNELPWAEHVAREFGTNHTPEIMTGSIDNLLPVVAQHYGEPFADSSAIPSFFVSRFAKESVTVVLSGDGGDELLGGYSRYAIPRRTISAGAIIERLIGPTGLAKLQPHWSGSKSKLFRAIRKCTRQAMSPIMGSLTMFESCWNDANRKRLLGEASIPQVLPDWRTKWLVEAFKHADNPIDRMLWMDNRTYLPDDLMVKMDIASMHCGLEARSPLLDQEVIEFCASLPAEFKVKNGNGKYLLKRLAERHFSKQFVYRRKMGFGVPVAKWLRGPLKAHVESVIFDNNLMRPLCLEAVIASWKQLINGTGQHADAEAHRIWTVFMFGQWRLIDSKN